MAVQHQHGDDDGRPSPRRVRHQPKGDEWRGYGGSECGERGHFKAERHHQPNRRANQSHCGRKRQQYAQSSCHTLAAFKAEKQRPHMSDQCSYGNCGYGDVRQIQSILQTACQNHRHQTFERVAQQSQRRRFFLAAAQNIGRARVARAVSARIVHAVIFGNNDGKRQRTD